MSLLAENVRSGNRRALARLLTYIENEREGVESALADLFSYTGNAYVIGVTGSPGTGKSSLVTQLALALRKQGKTVAILAVDPTSPFSGGAVLGDRIRMQRLSGDDGVFIRSMATRGSLGGLARAAGNAIRVLDAAGFDIILVETVGAGQSEVEIVNLAYTVVVVEAPGLGDGVQAIKAGILEIADILVVNKADLPGTKNTVRSLKAMLELGHPTKFSASVHHGYSQDGPVYQQSPQNVWIPPVIETIATEGNGFNDLILAIENHRKFMSDNMVTFERQMVTSEFYDRLRQQLLERFLEHFTQEQVETLIDRILSREISPGGAVEVALSGQKQKSS